MRSNADRRPAAPRAVGLGRIPRSSAIGAAGALVAFLIVVSALPVSASSLPATTHGVAGALPLTPTTQCNAYSSTTPSAILIPNANPSTNLTAGGTLSVAYEIAVVNYTNASLGLTLYIPNLWFKFPELNGATYEIHENATTFTVTSGSWTNASATQKSVVVPAGLAYNTSVKASLTSQKLAVMADANYGALTIELRWHWQNQINALSHPTGAWSALTTTTSKPSSSLPSIFEPAPYVYITHFATSAVIGSNYTDSLAGFVAGQRFFLEMEYPTSGKVVEDLPTTASANATSVNVSIPVLDYNGALSPGVYLVHVHDTCGALLWNKSVTAVYAPNASVQFVFSPATCGPITFNGTKYSNGTSAVVVPSTVAYNFSIPNCKGHSFHNWVTDGGLHIVTSKQLLVSASGTFTIEYN